MDIALRIFMFLAFGVCGILLPGTIREAWKTGDRAYSVGLCVILLNCLLICWASVFLPTRFSTEIPKCPTCGQPVNK